MLIRVGLSLALQAAVVQVCPREALAQTAASVAQARFERGVTLFDSSDFAGALTEFEAAIGAFNSPNVRLYIARSLVSLGRLGEGYVEMQRTAREAADLAQSSPRYERTRETAVAELAALESRVGRLRLTLARPMEGLSLRVAGREFPTAAIGTAIPVTPGAITVQAQAPGHVALEERVNVVAGQSLDHALVLALASPHASPMGPLGPTAPGEPLREAPAARMSLGPAIAVSAIAGVGVVGFVVGQVVAEGRYGAGQSLAMEGASRAMLDQVVSTGRSAEAASIVSIAVGAAAAVAAVPLFVVALRTRERESVRVGILPTNSGFVVGGTF